jgi:hypothetical protein
MTELHEVDMTSGEITQSEETPGIALVNLILNHGERITAEDLGTKLADVVTAVQARGKKGALTITIAVEELKGSGQLAVAITGKTTMPKPDTRSGIYFVRGGQLTRHDPRQMTLEGLTVITPNGMQEIRS